MGDPWSEACDLVLEALDLPAYPLKRDSRLDSDHVAHDQRICPNPACTLTRPHVSPHKRDPYLWRSDPQARPVSMWFDPRDQPIRPKPPISELGLTNPNLGISSPFETQFRPFKCRYDLDSEENYFGGYPNFCYKRFQKGESSQSSQGFWQSPYDSDSSHGDQAYPRGNPYKYQGRHYYP
uniref:Uncharacterized protein n=1 Tax=Fagus sylvatica TaxID=28930 RepID=A0A2N9F8J8_FAGSY